MRADDVRRGWVIASVGFLIGASTLPVPVATDFVTVARADPHTKPSDAAAVSVSADGRFVAFASNARLTPADQNAVTDIYVLDRQTGVVSLETPPSGGAAGTARAPQLNADGRILVYEAGIDGRNVLLRDRLSDSTRSLAAAGASPGDSHAPRITSAGDRVVFSSSLVDLVEGSDANGSGEDVYLFDALSDRYQRVSVDVQGRQHAAGSSFGPDISPDGRYVAFRSNARLEETSVPDKRSAVSNVYLRDTHSGTTIRISVGARGGLANGASYDPSVSVDGRYVAFVSDATNLVHERDANHAPDVFVRDTQRNVTELISRRTSGGTANGPSTRPRISADGGIVVFQSGASDLVCGGRCALADRDINLVTDIFACDRTSRAVRRISRGTTAWMESSVGPAMDSSGTVIAFSSRHPRDASDDQDDFDLFVWSPKLPD